MDFLACSLLVFLPLPTHLSACWGAYSNAAKSLSAAYG